MTALGESGRFAGSFIVQVGGEYYNVEYETTKDGVILYTVSDSLKGEYSPEYVHEKSNATSNVTNTSNVDIPPLRIGTVVGLGAVTLMMPMMFGSGGGGSMTAQRYSIY